MADLRLDCRAAFFASAQRVANTFLDVPEMCTVALPL